MPLSLAVQFAAHSAHLPLRAQVRRWAIAAHALAQEHLELDALDGETTIRYVDEKEGRELNKSFRGKDYATNVLTFVSEPLNRAKSPRQLMRYAADIAICSAVVAREAKAQRKTIHAHHAHMVIHGMLHALSFDHENSLDAQAMESIEIAVLRRFRINNPYE